MGEGGFLSNKEIAMSNTSTVAFATGKLAFEYCNRRLPLQVLRSQRGYYIGTISDEGPCSRESCEYFKNEQLAEKALASGNWTQKTEP